MTDISDPAELYRAIGRIEGAQKQIDGSQKQIIDKLNAMIIDQVQHQKDDRRDFQDVREAIDRKLGDHREEFDDANAGQDKTLASLASKIQDLEKQNEREKGAGWVILGFIGVCGSALGSVAVAALTGHIAWK